MGEGAGELHIVAESGTFSSNVIVVDDYTPIIASATITSDKNIIQSGGSANLTIIGKDKHNELVNSDTFDLCEQFIISKVSLNSNGIVQSGSTLDVKAKVNTSLGGVPNNVPVVFKKGDEVLNTVQTSTNGVATYGYQGSGVGQVNITAECDGVVSGTYSIIDGWFADYYDGYILGSSSITKEQQSDGVLFTASSGSQGFYLRKQGESGNYNYPTPCCLEFDVVSFGSGSNPNIQFYDGTTNISQTFSSLGITGACHVKCEYKSDKAYFTVDNGTPIVNNRVCTDNARIMLTAITSTLKINNVVIYPL